MITLNCRSLLILAVLGGAFFLSLSAQVKAQTTAARPDRGIMPGASYSVSDVEAISLTNGNVNLSIPLASLPPIAGGKLKLTLNAIYNSKLWNVTRQENQLGSFYGCPTWVVETPQLSDLGGWRISGNYRIVFRNAHDDFDYVVPQPPPSPDCESDVGEQQRLQFPYYRTILIGPDGAEHELRPTDGYQTYGGSTRSYLFNYYKDTPDTVGSPIRYYSFDGSYLYAVINPSSYATRWTVYMNDGTRIVQYNNGIQRITDTNGNSIKIYFDENGGHYQDEQTGREIRYGFDNMVWYQTVEGTWQSIDIVWGTTQVQGKLYRVNGWLPTGGETGGGTACQHDEVLASDVSVIREIVFPSTEPGVAARRYSFSYNSDTAVTTTDEVQWACGMPPESYTRQASKGMGALSQMVTPAGATVKYSYSRDLVHNYSPFSGTDDIPRETITQKQVIHDGVTDTWNYSIIEFAACGGTVTGPDGSVTTESCYQHDAGAGAFFRSLPMGGLVFRSNSSNKQLIERHWTLLQFSGTNSNATGNFGTTTFNPVVDAEYLTLLDDTPSHNPVKMSAKTYQYDFNGNLLRETDYDWFDPSLVTRGTDGVPTGVPASATVLRLTDHSHYNQASSSASANVYAKRSVTTGSPLILNALKQTTLDSSVAQFSYDGQAYGVAPTVGNLTSATAWDNLDNKWITTSSTYDTYGNLATSTDARGKVTQFFYDDVTHALPNRVIFDPQNGTGTQTTTTAFDYYTGSVTSQKDPNDQITTTDYTNQLLGTVDPFGRPGVVIGPLVNIGGVNQHRRVITSYLDSARQVIVATDLNAENDKLLKTKTTVDMLRRPILSEQTEDGTNYTLAVRNLYLDMGRVTLSSSPMRSTAASTDSWTRVMKDSLGRVTDVSTFGGATQPAWTGTNGTWTGTVSTSYDANFTTVSDQTGKLRRSMVDGLGRLVRVDEPDASNNLGTTASPTQPTNYAYDAFGNLVTVTQGAQTRTFAYDSLSRLRSATNPESGILTYQYDDNGNLVVKTDARGVSAHFNYDGINRLARRWYNGSNAISATTHNSPALPAGVGTTDETNLYYDTQSLPAGAPSFSRGAAVGRLVAQTYGTGSSAGDYFGHDVLGRPTVKIQQTGGVNYQLGASYGLSALTTLTYPSGHTATNTFDNAGRLSALSGNLGDGTTRSYATGILYAATGNLVKEQFGTTTPIYNKLFYNSRRQLAEIRTSTSYTGPGDTSWNRGAIINHYSNQCWGMCNGYGMSDNNGNLKKQQVDIPDNEQVSSYVSYTSWFAYDSLNRLQSANGERWASGPNIISDYWKQTFIYDRWGNRRIDTNASNTYGAGINNKDFTVNAGNNRLGVPSGQSGVMSYDAAGNLTTDTYTGAGNRTYDGENRITSAWGGNNQAQLYTYDSSGQRIKRTVNGVETWQVYGFDGELLAEYAASGAAASPQKEYGYRNGQLLITASASTNVQSTENVSWTGAANVTVTGNSLAKSAATSAWDAGANSAQAIVSGDSYVEMTVSETNKDRMLGLTRNQTTVSYTDLDFAIRPYDNGSLYVFELGANKGLVGSYLVGDKLRVALEAGAVKYYRIRSGTSTLLYTSSTAPTYPLSADTSFYTSAGTVSDAVISGLLSGSTGSGGAQNATFTNAVGVSVNSNSLTKTAAEGWNAGAASTQAITSGDGYMEFVASETTTARMAGLSHGDTDQNFTDIDYALYVADTNLCVYEAGTSRGCFGSYATGDVMRVAVEGGVVKYKKNGTVFYTSAVAPTYPLLVDSALWETGATINNVVISGTGVGAAAEIQWLVTDQLGTPRMIFDKTGSLANVKRHDYLPFGEEISTYGGRTPAQGYVTDAVRQKFTQKERDTETGLDYFLARYYASTQGRFTSADTFDGNPSQLYNDYTQSSSLSFAILTDPQTLNAYAYAYNNPISIVDHDGHQGGRKIPLPGNRRYQIRPDLRNPNDAPNIHVFDKGGRREIGRVAIKPGGPEWSGKVPESVKADVEAFIREKGIQPRLPTSSQPRPRAGAPEPGAAEGVEGGTRILRGTSNVLSVLAFITGVLDIVAQQRFADQHGYYLGYSGQMVITDLSKAAQNFPAHSVLDFGGHYWIPKGNTFVPLDDCDCSLEQDKDGNLHVVYRAEE